jgi:predicted aminopeptidase
MMAERTIDEMLQDPSVPQSLKERLSYVLALRTFAEQKLLLPVGRNYLSYAEIDRSYVVWNVFAAPELSLTPKTWCYPIVGCVAYRGYFASENADRCASDLQREGYDTFVSGALAYSTLGWFDDPVLTSFVRLDKTRLSALIFHELAHRMLYVAGDTTFNESFATAVEEEGLRKWAMAENTPDLLADYERQRRYQDEFVAMVMNRRRELEGVYSGDLPTARKKFRKTELIAALGRDFDAAKQKTPGMARYEAWFASGLNNAALAAVSAYHDLVPVFRRLLQESGGDLSLFYEKCRSLSQGSSAERNHRMQTLLRQFP